MDKQQANLGGAKGSLGRSASQRGYAHMGLILLVYVPCRACQCVAHVRACLSRLIDMIVTAGEAYGYHVAAILWLAAHVPQIASIWFDVNCRLKPFMLKNLEKCANAPYLQKMFGFAAPAILALRNAAFAIDEMHGSTHKGSCRDEFHGTMHETIPSYRAGALLAVRRSQNAPHTSCDAGVQAEHLNAPIYCEVREPVEAHGRSHTFGGNAAISRGLLFCAASEPASSTHARRRAGLRAQEYCAYIPTARLLLFQNMFGCNGRQASALCDWRLSSRCS